MVDCSHGLYHYSRGGPTREVTLSEFLKTKGRNATGFGDDYIFQRTHFMEVRCLLSFLLPFFFTFAFIFGELRLISRSGTVWTKRSRRQVRHFPASPPRLPRVCWLIFDHVCVGQSGVARRCDHRRFSLRLGRSGQGWHSTSMARHGIWWRAVRNGGCFSRRCKITSNHENL